MASMKTLALGAMLIGGYAAARVTARRARRISFHNKVVVITGGSRGLGLLLARRFGAEGAKVVIAARDMDEVTRAREELRLRGVDCAGFQCNVQLRTDVEALVRSATETYGGVDVWINNAGVIQVGPLELMTTHDYQE